MKDKIKMIYIALTAVIVWFGLTLQFYISIEKYLAEGRTLGGAIVQLLSYFTIQSNLLAALSLTLVFFRSSSAWGKFFNKTSVLTAIAVYITIVGTVYQLVLRKQFHLGGLFIPANEILHSFCPIAYVLFWLIFVQKTKIPWSKGLNWLIYPFIYFIYILIRGAISKYYPYTFIDANL